MSGMLIHKGGDLVPEQPISLNLARIVHRLMTSPRGWRVEQMRGELGIAQRTYRKYRQTLQYDFHPWRRRDGTTALVEVEDGSTRYLRLRPPRALGTTDPDLEAMAAAVHFATSVLFEMGSAPFVRAAELLMADFRASLRDRDFILHGLLADADRMFVAEACPVGAPDPVIANLIRAIANRRYISMTANGASRRVAPLSLILRATGLYCTFSIGGDLSEIRVDQLSAIEILADVFDYPPPSRYSPATARRDEHEPEE